MKTSEVKNQMIADLKEKASLHIENQISLLWGYAKEWAKKKCYEMGGSYASFGKHISVHLIVNECHHRFDISFEEIQ